jgi:UDP-glucose:(heptosyl)LPS alpha-1,3-glucosyltransferase
MAELAEHLVQHCEVNIFANSVADIDTTRFTLYHVPMIKSPSILEYFSFLLSNTALRAWLRIGRGVDFDIVHSTGPDVLQPTVATAHFCAAERLRLLREGVITFDQKVIKQQVRQLYHYVYSLTTAMMEKICFPRLPVLICLTNKLKQEVVDHYGVGPERVIIIPNAVNVEQFSPIYRPIACKMIRQQHQLSESDIVFLFVGGDWERKGVPTLLQAFARIRQNGQKLMIVGHGNQAHYLRICERLGITQNVTFVSHTDQVHYYYAAADVFVFPSRYEAFALTPLEAMASGLPILVSKVAGVNEIMEDGVHGLLLDDPLDVSELSRKMELLASDASLRAFLGKNARQLTEEWTWDRVCTQVEEVYYSLSRNDR